MCLAAHDTELPGGPLKCQTFTVSPAEPGDFPLLVNYKAVSLEIFKSKTMESMQNGSVALIYLERRVATLPGF